MLILIVLFKKKPDIKTLQIQLTGFLDKDTPKFCKDLWSLCLSAQENPQGVPKELLEAKKLELIQEKVSIYLIYIYIHALFQVLTIHPLHIDGSRESSGTRAP